MSDFQIESIGGGDYDLVMTDGDFVIIGNDEDTWLESVGQDLLYTFGVWYGESSFDESCGFPWRETVFGTHPIEGVAALVAEYAQDRPDVLGLEEPPIVEYDSASQRLTISLAATADEFVIPVTLEVPSR
jgi:hypothetical protein